MFLLPDLFTPHSLSKPIALPADWDYCGDMPAGSMVRPLLPLQIARESVSYRWGREERGQGGKTMTRRVCLVWIVCAFVSRCLSDARAACSQIHRFNTRISNIYCSSATSIHLSNISPASLGHLKQSPHAPPHHWQLSAEGGARERSAF